uniref:Uncharacterized protein n=1 Tax=Fagus sylvatica TaxID=28930 RepID=A0A2N9HTT1_FAGSY
MASSEARSFSPTVKALTLSRLTESLSCSATDEWVGRSLADGCETRWLVFGGSVRA